MVLFNRNTMYARQPTPPVTPKTMGGGEGTFTRNDEQQARWDKFHPLGAAARRRADRRDNPTPVKAASSKPSLAKYLAGDSTYQGQQSLFQKTSEDFKLSNLNQQGDVNEDFDLAMGRLGKEREKSHKNITGDFASRGMLNSGLFGQGLSEYDTDYQNTVFDLTKDKSRILEDLIESLGMFQNTVSGERMSAKQEAINRFAEQFGIMPGASVAPSKTSTSKTSSSSTSSSSTSTQAPAKLVALRRAASAAGRTIAQQRTWNENHPEGAAARLRAIRTRRRRN